MVGVPPVLDRAHERAGAVVAQPLGKSCRGREPESRIRERAPERGPYRRQEHQYGQRADGHRMAARPGPPRLRRNLRSARRARTYARWLCHDGQCSVPDGHEIANWACARSLVGSPAVRALTSCSCTRAVRSARGRLFVMGTCLRSHPPGRHFFEHDACRSLATGGWRLFFSESFPNLSLSPRRGRSSSLDAAARRRISRGVIQASTGA